MKAIAAKALLDCVLESPAGTMRTDAVLPFFTYDLKTKYLLVVPIEGRPRITRDLPTGVTSRWLAYRRRPRLRRLERTSFQNVWHFDPWWLLRDRDDVPAATRRRIVATNLAGRMIPEGAIGDFWYADGLTAVTSALIGGKRLAPRLAQPLLRKGPLEPVGAR